jgi:hypothetical protein
MRGAAATIGSLALALVLAACTSSDGVRTVRGDWSGYSPSYLQYAAIKGSLPALIRGEAFPGVPRDAFAGRVLDEMKDRPFGVGALSFKALPAGSSKPPLFVSLVFNPEPSFDSAAACDPVMADRAGGPPNPDGATRVVAAFCSSQRLLSGTVGEASGLTGQADPRFGRLVRLVMVDLFPPREPNLGPSCDSCP